MLFSEILDHLNYGPLAQMAMGDDGASTDTIDTSDHPAVISGLNAALLKLYTRFPLRKKEVIVQQYDAIAIYDLLTYYAQNSGSLAAIKYIEDTADDPFDDSLLIKVERLVDEEGKDLPLNDISDCDSYHLLEYNKIQVPDPTALSSFGVIYRAKPDKVVYNPTVDQLSLSINLPGSYLEPLAYYIAYHLMQTRPSIDGTNLAGAFLNMYEKACIEIENYGVPNKPTIMNNRLEDNGWV